MVGIVDVLVFCKGRERLEGRDVAYVVLEGVLAMHILSELAIFHVCIYMEQSIHVDTFDFDIPTFMVRQRLGRGKTSRERVLENESTPEAHTSIWSRTVVDLVIERRCEWCSRYVRISERECSCAKTRRRGDTHDRGSSIERCYILSYRR